MDREEQFLSYFEESYQGRLPISVGYGPQLVQIYPFVFENADGEAIGAVGLSARDGDLGDGRLVQIFHVSAFKTRRGDGSLILGELCVQADLFDVILAVCPIFLPNGRDPRMSDAKLRDWYRRFGFIGATSMGRSPKGGGAESRK